MMRDPTNQTFKLFFPSPVVWYRSQRMRYTFLFAFSYVMLGLWYWSKGNADLDAALQDAQDQLIPLPTPGGGTLPFTCPALPAVAAISGAHVQDDPFAVFAIFNAAIDTIHQQSVDFLPNFLQAAESFTTVCASFTTAGEAFLVAQAAVVTATTAYDNLRTNFAILALGVTRALLRTSVAGAVFVGVLAAYMVYAWAARRDAADWRRFLPVTHWASYLRTHLLPKDASSDEQEEAVLQPQIPFVVGKAQTVINEVGSWESAHTSAAAVVGVARWFEWRQQLERSHDAKAEVHQHWLSLGEAVAHSFGETFGTTVQQRADFFHGIVSSAEHLKAAGETFPLNAIVEWVPFLYPNFAQDDLSNVRELLTCLLKDKKYRRGSMYKKRAYVAASLLMLLCQHDPVRARKLFWHEDLQAWRDILVRALMDPRDHCLLGNTPGYTHLPAGAFLYALFLDKGVNLYVIKLLHGKGERSKRGRGPTRRVYFLLQLCQNNVQLAYPGGRAKAQELLFDNNATQLNGKAMPLWRRHQLLQGATRHVEVSQLLIADTVSRLPQYLYDLMTIETDEKGATPGFMATSLAPLLMCGTRHGSGVRQFSVAEQCAALLARAYREQITQQRQDVPGVTAHPGCARVLAIVYSQEYTAVLKDPTLARAARVAFIQSLSTSAPHTQGRDRGRQRQRRSKTHREILVHTLRLIYQQEQSTERDHMLRELLRSILYARTVQHRHEGNLPAMLLDLDPEIRAAFPVTDGSRRVQQEGNVKEQHTFVSDLLRVWQGASSEAAEVPSNPLLQVDSNVLLAFAFTAQQHAEGVLAGDRLTLGDGSRATSAASSRTVSQSTSRAVSASARGAGVGAGSARAISALSAASVTSAGSASLVGEIRPHAAFNYLLAKMGRDTSANLPGWLSVLLRQVTDSRSSLLHQPTKKRMVVAAIIALQRLEELPPHMDRRQWVLPLVRALDPGAEAVAETFPDVIRQEIQRIADNELALHINMDRLCSTFTQLQSYNIALRPPAPASPPVRGPAPAAPTSSARRRRRPSSSSESDGGPGLSMLPRERSSGMGFDPRHTRPSKAQGALSDARSAVAWVRQQTKASIVASTVGEDLPELTVPDNPALHKALLHSAFATSMTGESGLVGEMLREGAARLIPKAAHERGATINPGLNWSQELQRQFAAAHGTVLCSLLANRPADFRYRANAAALGWPEPLWRRALFQPRRARRGVKLDQAAATQIIDAHMQVAEREPSHHLVVCRTALACAVKGSGLSVLQQGQRHALVKRIGLSDQAGLSFQESVDYYAAHLVLESFGATGVGSAALLSHTQMESVYEQLSQIYGPTPGDLAAILQEGSEFSVCLVSQCEARGAGADVAGSMRSQLARHHQQQHEPGRRSSAVPPSVTTRSIMNPVHARNSVSTAVSNALTGPPAVRRRTRGGAGSGVGGGMFASRPPLPPRSQAPRVVPALEEVARTAEQQAISQLFDELVALLPGADGVHNAMEYPLLKCIEAACQADDSQLPDEMRRVRMLDGQTLAGWLESGGLIFSELSPGQREHISELTAILNLELPKYFKQSRRRRSLSLAQPPSRLRQSRRGSMASLTSGGSGSETPGLFSSDARLSDPDDPFAQAVGGQRGWRDLRRGSATEGSPSASPSRTGPEARRAPAPPPRRPLRR